MRKIQLAGRKQVPFFKWFFGNLMESFGMGKFNLSMLNMRKKIALLNKLSDGNLNCLERREISLLDVKAIYNSLPIGYRNGAS